MSDQAHPDQVTADADAVAAEIVEQAINPLKKLTFGRLVDGMYELRTEKQSIEAKAKKLGEELELMEAEILARLDAEETTMARGKQATAILTESQVPKVDDWDLFYAYMLEEEAMHMLQRRIAVPAARETIQAGDAIPGVSMFTKRQIGLRKIS
jgi:hypothetical protein